MAKTVFCSGLSRVMVPVGLKTDGNVTWVPSPAKTSVTAKRRKYFRQI
ncbi:hypothetical protein [Coleofasciculus sp. B1-GNL1-01]